MDDGACRVRGSMRARREGVRKPPPAKKRPPRRVPVCGQTDGARAAYPAASRSARAEMSKACPSLPATPESAAYSRKISTGAPKSNARPQPRREATSHRICQSCRAPTGAGRNARWRLMQRSELVTVPSFSPQVVAGRTTSARRAVSVAAVMSETTTKSQASIAARTASASGMVAAGLVWMIQSALIRPSPAARNMSIALSPGLSGMAGASQKLRTAARCSGFSMSR